MIAKLSLAINALLIAAVVYLFVKTSSSPEPVEETISLPTTSEFSKSDGPKAPILAYINGDVLNEKYNFIKDRSKALAQKYKAADEKVRKEYQKRQQEVEELMAYAQKGNVPDNELMVIQNRLQQLQMEMDEIQQKESNNVMEKETEMQKELQSRVEAFLKTYTKEKGIDYVVNYQPATQLILYGNEAYDITADVINGLNEAYEAEKLEEKK